MTHEATRLSLVLLVVLVLLPPVLMAQGRAGQRAPLYDKSTETTVTGTIERIEHPTMGRTIGTHLIVRTPQGPVQVDVGPSAFLKQRGYAFKEGETVEVTGSKVTRAGTVAIIARQIKAGGDTMTLRDANGIPLWAARGRRQDPR